MDSRQPLARPPRGHTLMELLAGLSVLVVLLGTGGPGLADWRARSRADNVMRELRGLLGLARQSAIASGREVTLCGTSDGSVCAATWDVQPTLIFVDTNRNRRLDGGERLIELAELTRAARIRWRASGGRNYLRYQPDGGVGEFGHFLYCPASDDPRFARQLVLSATGRPRASRDSDGDGIVEDRNGKPLKCPPD